MPTIDYRLKDGTRISGVTTIISSNLGWSKGALMYWSWNEGKEGRDYRKTSGAAADAGTIAHYLIECDIKGKTPDVSKYPKELVEKVETAYLNFLEWKETVHFEPFKTEVHLVSEEYMYGATPDCIAVIKGKLALFDWKTSNSVYEDHKIQLEAYRHVWNEVNSNEPIAGGLHLLQIEKENAAFHYHYWQAIPEAWEAFLCLLKLHNLKKTLK